jgi:hypothetical protein
MNKVCNLNLEHSSKHHNCKVNNINNIYHHYLSILIHHHVIHAFLRVGVVNKLSLIFESITEIRINNKPCRGINLTNTIYARLRTGHVWQPFANIVGSIQVPPIPSACLPRGTTWWTIRVWPVHYPGEHLYRNGGVSSNHYNDRATSVYWFP